MKRLIILLLVLSCFRFSYAEELNAEQQQLAWNYIYNLALSKSKDFHPTVFKDDIIINLKGKVTTEDSMVVKDIIKKFQKDIPHLKVALSNSPGNLILGLDFNKMTSITSNFNLFEAQSRKVQITLPENLNSYQRKQFIYYWLCNGIFFFNYNNSSVNILGLNGCVFCESDFNSITFSPFDLFILEKLYATDFSIQLSQNLPPELQDLAWKSIRTKFMAGHIEKPIIYHTDIAIKLEGAVSQIDSTCIYELINNLQYIIPNRKIFLTKEKANLVLTFTDTIHGIGYSTDVERGAIVFSGWEVIFSKNISLGERKKKLYNYLFNSLIRSRGSMTEKAVISGCVFDVDTPENIIYHPVDAFILNKLYSDDLMQQFKDYILKTRSLNEYYNLRYNEELKIASTFGSYLFAALIFSILILLKVFRKHNWNFRLFLIQMFWGIVAYDLVFLFYLTIKHFSLFIALKGSPSILMNSSYIALLAIYFFIVEKRIHFSVWSAKTKLFLVLTNTLVVSYIGFVLLAIFFKIPSEFDRFIYTFLFAMAITIIRIFIISISAANKAEIKRKDDELSLLKEKNKQAELQSLRAKINPHFLYNALNSIASLATTDAHKTEQMALALSDFFKYAINREQKQLNTLSEELNAIRTYLEIEKVRFGDRLSFEIDCPAELLEIQIPQLLIQPLVENAIKHGLSQITDNGLIRISVSDAETQLKIRVYDNGPTFPDGPLSGFGIQNTQERISLLYGSKATMNWQNGEEKFIEISIPV